MIIKAKIKQYGLKNSFLRGVKSLFRRIGIQYESFYLMVNKIEPKALKQKMQQYDYFDVRELTYDDFKLGDPEVFTSSKMQLIKSRFENGKYWAYGIIDKNKLAYSCWITTNKISFPSKFNMTIDLLPGEGFLEDAHTHPEFRGKGLHSKMNLYRICKLFEKGKNKNFVVLLCENLPAYKSQIKSGFSRYKKKSFLIFWGKQISFEKTYDI